MNFYFTKQPVLTLLMILLCGTASAQDSLPPFLSISTDTLIEYKLTKQQYQVLPDKTGKLTIDDVRSAAYNTQFFTKDKSPANVDTMTNVTWYRYNVVNSLEREINVSLVTRSYYSEFFVFRNSQQPTHYRNGLDESWNVRDGLPSDNIIPIKLKAGEQVVIYNRVGNDIPGTLYGFEVKLYNTEKYALKRLAETQTFTPTNLIPFFIFCGLCLLGGFFNFFLFLIDKQKVNLYFSLLLFVMGFIVSPINQIGVVRYASPIQMILIFFIATSLFVLFFIQFIRHYFQSFINTPRFDKFLIFLVVLQLARVVAINNYIPRPLDGFIGYGTILISCLAALFVYYRLKHPGVKAFSIAILPYGFAVFFIMIAFFFQVNGYSFSAVISSSSQLLMILSLSWSMLYFTWTLFKQYEVQKRKILQNALDTERLAKDKEIEKNNLIEQQKVELEKTVLERTAELRQSIEHLKSTQSQLIQSEKMASLGELTAGIAHEIQNPLNFVNNFSEVSTELVDEMNEEIDKGNLEDAKEIANDIKQNLEKINHHGKRAGDIVKGMLQHSRSGSGVKEPTDINALCDEYLRLSYHGLRAKDKSFNATMKTDFDTTIGNINIIPQDIGRVILNLITNAFYVVDEKSKQNITGYEPTVEVYTKKEGNKVLVSVKDNGNGIPQKILDKIFQPFFTTKPTGQGTGLGLSLSYDIVKVHGGELKVETKEGLGSEFIITLPI